MEPQPAILRRAVEAVRSRTDSQPAVAVILGSGAGGLAGRIDHAVTIGFGDIPGFAEASAGGHRGALIAGRLFDHPTLVLAGRFHRYEGHTNEQVGFPVRLLASLGVRRLVITNAAGAVNPNYHVGDLVVIRDHLNWMPGPWPSLAGPGRPLPSMPRRHDRLYDARLAAAAIEAGLDHGFAVREGTYLATLGPTYETRAEYRMMRTVGADVVGMSTVPEVLVAGAVGQRVLAISMVSNVANPDRPATVNHDEVLRAGRAAADKMEAVVRAVFRVSERDRDAETR